MGFSWLSWEDDQQFRAELRSPERRRPRRRGPQFHAGSARTITASACRARARYREILNSDSTFYGGSNLGNAVVVTEPVACMGRAQSIGVDAAATRRDLADAGLARHYRTSQEPPRIKAQREDLASPRESWSEKSELSPAALPRASMVEISCSSAKGRLVSSTPRS